MGDEPAPPSKWDMIAPEEQPLAHAIIALAPLLDAEDKEKYADILEGEPTETLDIRVAKWRERNQK